MGTVDPIVRSDGPEPLWQQAAEAITQEIASGNLAGGARLPSERELSERFDISRVTLRRALKSLIDAGVLTASHGRGWYVTRTSTPEFPNTLESFSKTAHRLGLQPSSTVLRSEVSPATLDEAELLLIAAGAPMFRLERVRLLDDVPVAVDTTSIATALYMPGEPAPDYSRVSLYDCLAAAGLDLARSDTTIEARDADETLAVHLGIDVGMPVLEMHQVVFDRTSRPLLESTIRYAGARYRLRTSFSRSTVQAASMRESIQGEQQ